jgi:hypothetical protein
VHMSLSLQSSAAPGWHVPLPLQVSAMVHMLPSSHMVPGATGSPLVHMPLLGLQPPWKQTGGGGQDGGLPGWQVPPLEQVSFRVQALPSSQEAPGVGAPTPHEPLSGSHIPGPRQVLVGQLVAVPATHAPAPSQ